MIKRNVIVYIGGIFFFSNAIASLVSGYMLPDYFVKVCCGMIVGGILFVIGAVIYKPELKNLEEG